MNNRITELRSEMKEQNLDAFLVTTPKNVRYLSSFTGSAGLIVITPEHEYFITDFRYTDQAKEQAKGFDVIIHQGKMYEEISKLLNAEDVKAMGIEADDMNVSTYSRLSDLFEPMLVQTSGVIEMVREVNSEDDIEKIREACDITDQAFELILTFIRLGVSEMHAAIELDRCSKIKGSSDLAFDMIVASGLLSSMPHVVASDNVIEHGHLGTLDFGCYPTG